jgi:hypothetical protein
MIIISVVGLILEKDEREHLLHCGFHQRIIYHDYSKKVYEVFNYC